MKQMAISIFLCLGMAGCQSSGGLGPAGSALWMSTADADSKLAHYKEVCAGYGYKENEPGMKQCIQLTAINLEQNAKQAGRDFAAAMEAARPRHTTCSGWGYSVRCTTY